ncbi:biotin/lipoyl-containing protein [Citricoccus sp.]|uniref:biotin/lipoyl-containing protein n=1 Tax=Citricoccus sp. TaxID=1978372 RepID=UPI0028BD420B|nr:biotin/lipoyl-containing protein [Citricoccus sp.]
MEIFTLPDVGEGLTEAEITEWRVAVGDTVAVNDVLCEIETAKSLVELPSPYAGTVAELMAPAGETIEVGTPIIGITTAASPDGSPEGSAPAVAETGYTMPAEAGATSGDTAEAGVGEEAPVPTDGGDPARPSARGAAPSGGAAEGSAAEGGAAGGAGAALTGSGPKADAATRRPRKPSGQAAVAPSWSPRLREEPVREAAGLTVPSAPAARGLRLPA